MRPCLSRTTTGTSTRLTLTAIGGARYCGLASENDGTGEGEIGSGWLAVMVAGVGAVRIGVGAVRIGVAACGCSDIEPASSLAAFCSRVSAFATGTVARTPEGTLTDGVATCCGRDRVEAVSRGDFSPAAGEAWTLGAVAVIHGADRTAAADCSVRIRDVEANMW